jgi:hypothetical protein
MPGLVPEATGQPGGTGMADPFGMANSLMDFQNKMNQNRKFQAEFMANQALGEVMAHSPSLEEGANQAMQNPLIAGFATQGLQNYRAMQLLQYQGAEVKQKLGQSGYEAAVQAGLQAAQDPVNYNKYFDDATKLVDPLVQDRVKPMIDSVRAMIGSKVQGLDMGNPADLAKARSAITAAVGGAYVAAGGDPGRLTTFLPTTKVDEAGNVWHVPSAIGAAQGQAPTLGTTAPGPIGAAPQGSAPPVVTNSSSQEQYPLDTSGAAHYMNLGPNGKPAIGAFGRPVINPAFVKTDERLQTEHDTNELASYNADKGMLSSVAQMQAAADDLTAKGGFTTPGFMGVARGQIASAMETVENITGKKFTGDATLPAENADVQTINKWHGALSFQLKNMLESTGARGLGVLMEASSAVPSMENTPLAFKVLTSGLAALANWDIGKYEYKEAYRRDPATGGSLLGSDLAYNKVSSPLDAAKNELGKIGVVLDGSQLRFSDDKHLLNAYETGLFGKRKNSPTDKDGPAEKAMDAMWAIMHPEAKK